MNWYRRAQEEEEDLLAAAVNDMMLKENMAFVHEVEVKALMIARELYGLPKRLEMELVFRNLAYEYAGNPTLRNDTGVTGTAREMADIAKLSFMAHGNYGAMYAILTQWDPHKLDTFMRLVQKGIARDKESLDMAEGIYEDWLSSHAESEMPADSMIDYIGGGMTKKELGGPKSCKRCGSPLLEQEWHNGFCSDVTCPYSDRGQDEEFTEG